jgi:hypothetical protein
VRWRWPPWSKRDTRPAIPKHVPPAPLIEPRAKPDPGIEVIEHDVSKLTETGVHKAWRRGAGKDPPNNG